MKDIYFVRYKIDEEDKENSILINLDREIIIRDNLFAFQKEVHNKIKRVLPSHIDIINIVNINKL